MNKLATPEMVTAVWIILFFYIGCIVFFVVRGARRTHNMADYATGSMNFSPAFLGLSIAASISSAATFIINPGFVAYYGLAGFLSMAIFLPIGMLVSLAILSKRFRKYGQSVQARTIGQWMGKARRMAAEFQGHFNEAMREAEMADLKKSFDEVRDATSGLTRGNLMTRLTDSLGEPPKLEDLDKPSTTANSASVSGSGG